MAVEIKKDLEQIAKEIVIDAKAHVPVRTGMLKNSISYDTNFISNQQFQIVIMENDYGQYVNYKDHYMTDAINKNINQGIDDIAETMIDEILKPLNPKK